MKRLGGIVALVALLVCVTSYAARAAADPPLSSLMAGPPPGFTTAPSGVGISGSISGDDIARFAPAQAPAFDELERKHQIEGYGATWVDRTGGSSIIVLYRLRNTLLALSFFRGGKAGIDARKDVTTFKVSAVPNAIGFTQVIRGFTANEIFFRSGRYVADVVIGSRAGKYAQGDTVLLAEQELHKLPPSDDAKVVGAVAGVVGGFLILVIVGGIIAFVIVRSRRKRTAAPAAPPIATGQCENGHPMTADQRFCVVCGAPPRMEGPTSLPETPTL